MLTWIRETFCQHKTGSLTKREGDRVFVECMDCGKQSRGVLMPLPRKRRISRRPLAVTVMHSGPVPVFIPKKRRA